MRTGLCISGRHHGCGGMVNRGTSQAVRLDGCSCQCHRKRTAQRSPIAGTVRRWVRERDGHQCQARVEGVCTGEPDHIHHLLPRSRGGDEEMGNLLTVCAPGCHEWIHANPEEATALGLLRASWDDSPVAPR